MRATLGCTPTARCAAGDRRPKGGRLSFAYNGEGRVIAVTNQMSVTYHLIRDAAGRIVATVRPDAPSRPTSAIANRQPYELFYRFDFNCDGRHTEYTRDIRAREASLNTKSAPTDSNENPLIWGTVGSKISRYFLLLPDGTKKPDEETRSVVRLSFINFLTFFSESGLLKVSPFDANGNFSDKEYRRKDLTEEGYRMLQQGAEKWLSSKGAKKLPPNFNKLNSLLEEIKSK